MISVVVSYLCNNKNAIGWIADCSILPQRFAEMQSMLSFVFLVRGVGRATDDMKDTPLQEAVSFVSKFNSVQFSDISDDM